eukprot:TRINITY_DN45884_c0_g1_i1.p1 TRINITY_DN45884_c0_g1~~TRINITY_DN45884_c0_g1_i1.p1  ORF type:complete len:953 (-),score=165.96 TRINITY_DN45884_c0_g1_i1:221-3079(-)
MRRRSERLRAKRLGELELHAPDRENPDTVSRTSAPLSKADEVHHASSKFVHLSQCSRSSNGAAPFQTNEALNHDEALCVIRRSERLRAKKIGKIEDCTLDCEDREAVSCSSETLNEADEVHTTSSPVVQLSPCSGSASDAALPQEREGLNYGILNDDPKKSAHDQQEGDEERRKRGRPREQQSHDTLGAQTALAKPVQMGETGASSIAKFTAAEAQVALAECVRIGQCRFENVDYVESESIRTFRGKLAALEARKQDVQRRLQEFMLQASHDLQQKHAVRVEFERVTKLLQSGQGVERQLNSQLQQRLKEARDNALEPELIREASLSQEHSRQSNWFTIHELVKVNWMVKFGNTAVPLQSLQALPHQPLTLRFQGQTFFVSAESLRKTASCTVPSVNRFDIFRASLGLEATLQLEPKLQTLAEELRRPNPAKEPKLKQPLLPYQEQGFSWMMANLSNGFGCLLCDSMGLGKTIQALAVVQMLKDTGQLTSPAAVVMPRTLLSVWEAEIGSKTSLVPRRFDSDCKAPSKRPRLAKQCPHDRHFDLLLMTYEMAAIHCESLCCVEFSMLVFDEIQYAKNYTTQRWQALQLITQGGKDRGQIPRILGLTGTPIENRLADLWSIFHLVLPGYLGASVKTFLADFEGDLQRLRKVIAPFMLRRTREDREVAEAMASASCAQKFTQKISCELSPQQAVLYAEIQEARQRIMESASRSHDRKVKQQKRFETIMGLLNDLTKVCNHPHLYDANVPLDAALSGKADCLLSLLEGVIDAGEKALIFTRFIATQSMLVQLIEQQLPTRALAFNGKTQEDMRSEICNRFKDSEVGVLVLTIGVGSLGLNLTAANHVFHYDRWWNPARERQAEDRCYRIGQMKDVRVVQLVSKGTFEERLDELLQGKEALARDALELESVRLTEMDDQALAELFALRQTGANKGPAEDATGERSEASQPERSHPE